MDLTTIYRQSEFFRREKISEAERERRARDLTDTRRHPPRRPEERHTNLADTL